LYLPVIPKKKEKKSKLARSQSTLQPSQWHTTNQKGVLDPVPYLLFWHFSCSYWTSLSHLQPNHYEFPRLPRSFQRKVYLKITELYLWEIPYLHFQGNCTLGVAILFLGRCLFVWEVVFWKLFFKFVFIFVCYLKNWLMENIFQSKKNLIWFLKKYFFFILGKNHFSEVMKNLEISYYLLIISNLFLKLLIDLYFV